METNGTTSQSGQPQQPSADVDKSLARLETTTSTKPEALLWIDVETTGPDRTTAQILEIGMACTDGTATQDYGAFHAIVKPDILDINRITPWAWEHHTANGLIAEVRAASTRQNGPAAVGNAAEEYLESLEQRFQLVPTGTNVDFDLGFLGLLAIAINTLNKLITQELKAARAGSCQGNRLLEECATTRSNAYAFARDKIKEALADAVEERDAGNPFLPRRDELVTQDMHTCDLCGRWCSGPVYRVCLCYADQSRVASEVCADCMWRLGFRPVRTVPLATYWRYERWVSEHPTAGRCSDDLSDR